jgi:uncharacterized protein (DUF433 family)
MADPQPTKGGQSDLPAAIAGELVVLTADLSAAPGTAVVPPGSVSVTPKDLARIHVHGSRGRRAAPSARPATAHVLAVATPRPASPRHHRLARWRLRRSRRAERHPARPPVVSRRVTRCYSFFMADHYTLRLAPGIRQRLSEWARRSGMPERSLAQRYVDEGLRHDAHPLIQFLDGPSGRRASITGRGVDVWEVIATIRDNDGWVAEAASYLDVPVGLVEAAVAYYGEYKDEIDREIDLNEAEYERGIAAAAAGEQALRG